MKKKVAAALISVVVLIGMGFLIRFLADKTQIIVYGLGIRETFVFLFAIAMFCGIIGETVSGANASEVLIDYIVHVIWFIAMYFGFKELGKVVIDSDPFWYWVKFGWLELPPVLFSAVITLSTKSD